MDGKKYKIVSKVECLLGSEITSKQNRSTMKIIHKDVHKMMKSSRIQNVIKKFIPKDNEKRRTDRTDKKSTD